MVQDQGRTLISGSFDLGVYGGAYEQLGTS
jgi:hypothetical protein